MMMIIGLIIIIIIIYKSLFTENSVATQKRYSTSINTNKIQNTTINILIFVFSF